VPVNNEVRVDASPVLVGGGAGWSTHRLRDPGATGTAPASLALVAPVEPIEGEASLRTTIRFAGEPTPWAWRIEIEAPGADVYGLGEVPGPLRRNGRRTVCWNTDDPGYEIDAERLYQSHPWVLGVRPDGSAYGVLVDTTWRCRIDPDERTVVVGEGGRPNVYVIEGEEPAGVIKGLAALTGRMSLPARWTLGYHQCRWSYASAARVLEVAKAFRERSIPCDAIWMDIDYMDGFRCFTFSPEGFPEPAALCEELHALGFRTVWMIDPGIKKEPGYAVYDEGTARDAWVMTASGEPFTGMVWPGDCVFPDFTREDVRTWWAGLYADWLRIGVDGVWNDMNEPAVFDGEGKTMPEDNRHEADEALGGPDAHARYHNVYGMLMVRATREGVLAARPERRPFVLTRSNFVGGHRYAATWTGDNNSTWENLAWSIPMILNLGLSGQPFSGPDIGGFNGEADGELFARWMGIGTLLPFARGHTVLNSEDHEPWSFGPECERICRLAIERRMRLLPYLYTVFEEASRTGLPIARPLLFADPSDPALRDAEDSFLLGRDLLVRARVTRDGECHAPWPKGGWAALDPVIGADPELPTLWVRRGSAIPLGPVTQHVADEAPEAIELAAHLDEQGEARGTIYVDEGEGHAHERGVFARTTYLVRAEGPSVEIERREGGMDAPASRIVPIVLESA